MDEELERYRMEQAHTYLERIRKMGEDCAGLQAMIDDAYCRAEGVKGIDYSRDIVRSSPYPDAIPDAVARLQEWIRDYAADLAAYEAERHEAHMALSRMGDQGEARVLRLRYLLGWKWERICTETNYTWDGMMSLRRRALSHYWDVMPRQERDMIPKAF